MGLFDWTEIRTKIMWSVISALGLGFIYLLYPAYQQVGATVLELAAHKEEYKDYTQDASEERQDISEKLDKVIDRIDREYYIAGVGEPGTFGSDARYVRINRSSNARIYREGEQVIIRLIDIDGRPRVTLPIQGTFRDANQDLLVRFSRAAAENLEIEGTTEVELEPVRTP
jgi:hypothetical protein